MRLLLHNDGKGRHQSFEVWCPDLEDCPMGYGRDAAEAKEDFFAKLEEYIAAKSKQLSEAVRLREQEPSAA